MKYRWLLIGVCVVLVLSGWWVYMNGEAKELILELQWGEDQKTKKNIPIIELTYRFNGVEDKEAAWLIFPDASGKWEVYDLGQLQILHSKAKSENERNNSLQSTKADFNYEWVEARKYRPWPSIYESIMSALGFETPRLKEFMVSKLGLNPLFYIERAAFLHSLKLARDYDEGRLRPTDIIDKKHYKATTDMIPRRISSDSEMRAS